jgi:hypothetical protein
MNPEALVEAVSKSQLSADALKFVGAELPPPAKKEEVPPIPFTPLYEIEKAIERATKSLDPRGNRATTCRGRDLPVARGAAQERGDDEQQRVDHERGRQPERDGDEHRHVGLDGHDVKVRRRRDDELQHDDDGHVKRDGDERRRHSSITSSESIASSESGNNVLETMDSSSAGTSTVTTIDSGHDDRGDFSSSDTTIETFNNSSSEDDATGSYSTGSNATSSETRQQSGGTGASAYSQMETKGSSSSVTETGTTRRARIFRPSQIRVRTS